MQKNTLADWLSYIEKLHHSAIDLGLSRVVKIANELSLNHFSCPVITVAGTNGKGTCVACLSTVYARAGYKVATYTSPHIHKFNERIRLNNIIVSDDKLVAAFEKIEIARQTLALTLSFFEFTTLAALIIFKQDKPDVVLLEVGLGGRLDAVNVVDANIAVITSIALDHMDWLGSDRESILIEKMGVTRPGGSLIFGDEDPPKNFADAVKNHQVTVDRIGHEYTYLEADGKMQWRCGENIIELLPAAGLKPQNVATALMVIDKLQSKLPVKQNQIQASIADVNLPGRFEVLAGDVTFVLDVAHNPAAALWLATQLQARFASSRVTAIFGVMQDKDLEGIISPLLPNIDAWYLTDLPVKRGMPAQEIAEKLSAYGVKNCYNFESIAGALDAALASKQDESYQQVFLVFGSFLMVAGAREYFQHVPKEF